MGTSILQLGSYLFEIYYWLILISILGSWFPQFHTSKFGSWIYKIVEPYLGIFRRFIPPIGPIDISPLVALFVFRYIRGFALEGLRLSLNTIGV